MKKFMCIYWFLSLGCGTLNKDKLFSKHVTKETLYAESTATLALQQAITISDSSNNLMELTIWPKGPFTFSPTTGFAGEAFKVELKGRQSQLIKKSESLTSKSEVAKKLKSQKERVVKQKKKKVEWEGMGYGVGILMVVLVVGGVWLMRKKLEIG